LFRQDLFRQDSPSDWNAVMARVAAALKLFGLQK
jgi:hypothetical protein